MCSEERADYQKCVARIVGGPGGLSITLTDVAQWIPETPLKRGVVYKWAVKSIVNGKEVSSPAASAPEARFGILDQEKALELSLLKRTPSHLALGVFYARAGMLAEAEREFQSLVNDNPQSKVAIKLLRRIRSWR